MDVKFARQSGLKKVGEVADIFGTTPRTLLYYEEQNIIAPMKTSRGTRMYSEVDIKRFEIAYKMSCLGVPLKTIQDLATIRQNAATGDESGGKLCTILDELIEDIQRQIKHLDYMKQDLERGRLMIGLCKGCKNKPTRNTCPKCPCEVQMDQSQLLWLTWDPDRGNWPPSNPGEPPTKCMEASLPEIQAQKPGSDREAPKKRRGKRAGAGSRKRTQ
jgi:DNA-binding transcriptional MerR regulator